MSDFYYSETLLKLKQIASSSVPSDGDLAFVKQNISDAVCAEFFFYRLKTPVWLNWLIECGRFNTVPPPEKLEDGSIRFPNWPELQYLENICMVVPDQVVNVIIGFPPTDNRYVFYIIIDIAEKIPPEKSINLAPKVCEFIESKYGIDHYRFLRVLAKWAKVGTFDQLAGLLSRLLEFKPDPAAEEKIQRRKENPNDYFTSLEPQPGMHSHEYKEFIDIILPVLLRTMPTQLVELLIKITARMIDHKMHPDQRKDKTYTDDWSEIWCRRLVEDEDSLDNSPELLVKALTHSCAAVYENDPDNIQKLDQQLAKQRWKVFERIRQYLFGKYPDQADKEAVRAYILGYPHYDEYEYPFEFQKMLRAACIQFGDELLTEPERNQIFDTILSSPSKERFKEWMGDRYTEEKYEQRKDYFQRKQLLPFRPILFGQYEKRLQELEALASEYISDEDYSPVGKSEGGIVSEVSPKPKDELLKLSDPELLKFINSWNNGRRDYGDGLKEINVHGLSHAFQAACAEVILRDSRRLGFWVNSLSQITRPVYVKVLVASMEQIIKEGVQEHIADYLVFCAKVLDLPQLKTETSFRGDESDAEPRDWTSSRRAVCDLISTCLSKETEISIDYAAKILALLGRLCLQPDPDLDQGRRIMVNDGEMHPFTDAINNARSRAWEELFAYAEWKRRHDKTVNLSDAWAVIRQRIDSDCDLPLTLPEYAMLGRCYVHFFILKEKPVAKELKPALFPEYNQDAWSVAFTNFLAGSRAHPEFFDWFKDDYIRALDSFNNAFQAEWDHQNLIKSVGDGLFLYYLWDLIPEDGPDALLKKYYESTKFDTAHWDKLLSSTGFMFGRTSKPLSAAMEQRVHSFLEWRISEGCKKELTEFTHWLEATCFDQRWLLGVFSKILDLIANEHFELLFTFEALARNTEVCLDVVLDCLQKISVIFAGKYMHPPEEQVMKILRAGFASTDSDILDKARCCRENLLKARRFEFLNVGSADE
ncbi:MAG: hypothetical protein GXY61_02745 [Lentisphaerae bacterium]|nr:hypothetical protein [Lentisphaerota bacterium]